MTPIERDPNKGLNGAVAAVLRAERAAASQRLTQDEIADKAEIPVVSLRRYLNGKRAIDMSVLSAICKAMGVDPQYVMAEANKRVSYGYPSDADVNVEDLYDEPSAAAPKSKRDVEGEVDPDLQ